MIASTKSWFATSRPGSTCLRCCVCRQEIDLRFPSVDHHPAACPACGAECVFVSWKDVLLQIAPQEAPAEMTRAIRWAQGNLDELEFMSLLAHLAQVGQALQAEAALASGH